MTRSKKHSTTILIHIIFCSLGLMCEVSGQNVGINTSLPTARLHIQNQLIDSTLIYSGFESESLPPFTTYGDGSWEFTTENAWEGNYSIYSGELGDSDSVVLELAVEVPLDRTAHLSFMIMVDSEIGADFVTLSVDGNPIWTASGEEYWQLVTHTLLAGPHILQWMYQKDDETSNNGDAAWLDSLRINFIPNYSIRIADGNELDGRVLVSDIYGNGLWQTLIIDDMFDLDDDTGIHVELFEDEDVIRFYSGGFEGWQMKRVNNNVMLQPGAQQSVLIGSAAGQNGIGMYNTYLGNYTGHLGSTGSHNVFVGQQAGYSNAASNNTFIGSHAGISNVTGINNSFLGRNSGSNNQGGSNNLFGGHESGAANTSGNENVYLGNYTANSNTTGNQNVHVGYLAGSNSFQTSSNVFMGAFAGLLNSSGEENVFLGTEAGKSNSTGNSNVFIGFESGQANGNGTLNTYAGYRSGISNSGNYNTFVGGNAGWSNTNSSGSTIIGASAGSASMSSYNTFLGAFSGHQTTGGENTFLGTSTGTVNTTGTHNLFAGFEAGSSNFTGDRNTFIGRKQW